MTVRLYWTDKNLAEDGHRVYRSTSPMDPQALPAPLVSLGADVESYDDATAVNGTTYYYRVSAYVGSVEKVSDEFVITVGSNNLVEGKVEFFYDMSNITATEIVDGTGKYNGILKGTTNPTQVALTNGYALQFSGNGQYVAIKGLNFDVNEQPTEFSAGCWFKTSNGHDQILISFDRSETFRLGIGSEAYRYGSGTLGANVYTDDGLYDLSSLTVVTDGEWHLGIMVFDNGHLTVYLDGKVEQAQQCGVATKMGVNPTGEPAYGFLGTGSEARVEDGTTGPDYWFGGLMTKAFYMRRVMQPEEVAAMYNRGADS